MESGAITSYIDVAQVVLYVFWAFFAGLIFYLRREDRREGYPLRSEITGEQLDPGIIWVPDPKVFVLEDGSRVEAPSPDRDDGRKVAAKPTEYWPGAPLEPTGNPMRDGVGPAAYAQRADKPDVTHEGHAKIVPMRVAKEFAVVEGDPDPRGMDVIAADQEVAGTVADVWVDRGEAMIRYLEVDLGSKDDSKDGSKGKGKSKRVLVPIAFARINGWLGQVNVRSILSTQFKHVPVTKKTTEVTRLEEDRISAYYAGGTLYAMPERLEPLI